MRLEEFFGSNDGKQFYDYVGEEKILRYFCESCCALEIELHRTRRKAIETRRDVRGLIVDVLIQIDNLWSLIGYGIEHNGFDCLTLKSVPSTSIIIDDILSDLASVNKAIIEYMQNEFGMYDIDDAYDMYLHEEDDLVQMIEKLISSLYAYMSTNEGFDKIFTDRIVARARQIAIYQNLILSDDEE